MLRIEQLPVGNFRVSFDSIFYTTVSSTDLLQVVAHYYALPEHNPTICVICNLTHNKPIYGKDRHE